jgi:polar amino acid transport system substrate-binding protein
VRGKNAGVDVEIAKWFARYAFGREQRLTFVCAPTAVREPLLTNGRVDLVISTFTYTADRDTRIDFSRPYYKATGRLLVRNDSPIQSLANIGGRKVSTTSGSVYDRWMKRCFTSTEVVVVDSVTNAVLAFNQGRVDAVMFDDTSLALIAATNPNAKLTDDLFLEGPYGIGIKQGNVELKRWVDSRLNLMKRKDIFQQIIKNNIAPRFVPAFSKNILRPNNDFAYRAATLPSVDTVCP